jgi:GT2 family glycosyltransferase
MFNISLIIATYNRIKYLNKLLHQVISQELPAEFTLTIIVVVDGSNDGTNDMLKKDFPEIHIVQGNGSWWWTKCMNEGFKKAFEIGSDFVIIMNDDTEIKPDFIKKLLRDYNTLPEDSILGSASISIDPPYFINSAGSKEFIRWRLKCVPYVNGILPFYPEFKGVHPTWSVSGRGTLIPRNAFARIGFYDENLVQYGSDDDFILRAKKSGINCFISWNAHVYNHLTMTSEGTAFRKDSFFKFLNSFFNPHAVNSLKKEIYYYNKHGYKLLLPIYLIYVFLGTINAYLFKYK